ncbi:MAG: hypothetical protein JNJ57_22015 [Saprospiraceae bacterium]|nr:hypothetical protein [Saprospiraceae bacterium]
MDLTTLDEPIDFTPSENERPAGEWMEGYWDKTAYWARNLAFGVFFFTAWMFVTYVWFLVKQESGIRTGNVVYLIQGAVSELMIAGLGYFMYWFGVQLRRALQNRDQLQLEAAFLKLRSFLILGLLVAAIWCVLLVMQYYRIYFMLKSYNQL